MARSVILSFLVLLFLSLAGSAENGRNDISTTINTELSDQNSSSSVFLEATKAKSFIRHRSKRGWWRGEENEEEEESRENNHRINLARTCPTNCWGTWSSWSSCSSPCGNNGYKTAKRNRAPPGSCRDWVNKNGCPGQSSKRLPCNRFCKNGGSPRSGSCACKTGYYGTCCQHRITCNFPGKPTNGAVKPSSARSYYGTKVTFTCSVGYRMIGSSTRTCQANGKWDGYVPRCDIVTCGDPGTPKNGKKVGTNYQYKKTVVFQCNTGYRLAGASSIRCFATARWSHSTPTCQPVKCPVLSAPSGGSIKVPGSPQYRSVATYSCHTGYYMAGPKTRTCQANGKWDGADTKCLRITCGNLPKPQNGGLIYPAGSTHYYGQRAMFSCRSGYTLRGSRIRTCGGTQSRGVWSGKQPTCTPVSCGDPGSPKGGLRIDSKFTFPSALRFQCLPGHYMRGAAKITCLATGRWSAKIPACNVCAVNHYKTGSSGATSCTRCPAHSHTAGQGSTTIKQCVCDRGFRGNPGGPCTQIRCPSLTPPKNGHVSSCQTTVDGACNLGCNRGHIRTKGDAVRKCKLDGKWSGSSPVCSACPKNTYQASQSKCTPCSAHSYTRGVASVRTDCICSRGFSGPAGGPCKDVNECKSGNGGCEQKCENAVGSFKCVCNIPGFKVTSTNIKKCTEYLKCPAFPTPTNGGAVCNRILAVNTRRCQVKCNYGFDHLESPQEFEECGPNTGWKWSFEAAGRTLPPCIEQTFIGVELDAAVFYLDDRCGSLTTSQRQDLRRQFVAMLQARGLCKFQGRQVCNIDQVRIECGEVEEFGDWLGDTFIKKRSVRSTKGKEVVRFTFAIEVPPVAARKVSCSRYCGATPVDSEACKRTCRTKYTAEMDSKVNQTGIKLKKLFHSQVKLSSRPPGVSSTLTLSVGGRSILPASPNINLSATKHKCKPGTALHNGFCMSCDRGSVWNARTKKCEKCPRDTHVPRLGMTRCLPCPRGSSAPNPGATRCVVSRG